MFIVAMDIKVSSGLMEQHLFMAENKSFFSGWNNG
jgi:hypothetical protein